MNDDHFQARCEAAESRMLADIAAGRPVCLTEIAAELGDPPPDVVLRLTQQWLARLVLSGDRKVRIRMTASS